MLARQIDWIIAYANSLAFDIAKAVCEQSFGI